MRRYLINSQQYDPFGMILSGRSWEAGSGYRYGFNAQEQDDEVYGNGNLNTATFWDYDTRLGRRWNVDPKPNPAISSYASFLNNPMIVVDIYGDTTLVINAQTGTVLSYIPDNLYSNDFVIMLTNPTDYEIRTFRENVSSTDYALFQAELAGDYVIYDLDSPRNFFKENYQKTVAGENSIYGKGLLNSPTADGKGSPVTLYSEYETSMTINNYGGIDMVGVNPNNCEVTSGDAWTVVGAEPEKDFGFVSDIHIHSNERGYYFYQIGEFRSIPSFSPKGYGPSPSDYLGGFTKGVYYNVLVDEYNIYFYQDDGQNTGEGTGYMTPLIIVPYKSNPDK